MGPNHPRSALDVRLASQRLGAQPVILDRLWPGWSAPPERAVVGFHDAKPPLYPFTLAQKLDAITEPHPWYTSDKNPWGRPILPIEMVSVLTQYTSDGVLPIRQPSVALFVDQEIRLHAGPLFVDQPYLLDREVVALGESRRTESFWVRTGVRHPSSQVLVATTLLHTAVLKDSYPSYPSR